VKSFTNHAAGPRGINLTDSTTRWVEPGETVSIDPKTIVGDLPDFGKAGDASGSSDENAALRKRVAELESENSVLLAKLEGREPATEPGPLDQSVEKLTAYLETVTDAAEIEKLIEDEKGGKSRSGALAVLEARLDAVLA
jgi:hypothetical protein